MSKDNKILSEFENEFSEKKVNHSNEYYSKLTLTKLKKLPEFINIADEELEILLISLREYAYILSSLATTKLKLELGGICFSNQLNSNINEKFEQPKSINTFS